MLTDNHVVSSYEISGKSIFGAIPVLFEVISNATVHRAQTRAGENVTKNKYVHSGKASVVASFIVKVLSCLLQSYDSTLKYFSNKEIFR